MDEYSKNRRLYLRAWRKVLSPLLGWDDRQVTDWSQRWQESLDTGQDGWFYHEAPGYFIAGLLLEELCGYNMTSVDEARKWFRLTDYLTNVNGKPLWDLDERDIADIRAFLESLTRDE